ncbi:MAG: hypothetical protein NTW86_17285 [Candidatus Sumerlaeota bacterium]|nr:hypothetical protein [Candidatus Sumerlaeota bacterium]
MSLAESISEHLANLPPERQAEVLDFVLFLEQNRERTRRAAPDTDDMEARRRRVTAALDALRQSGAFAGISDPVAWQREIRQDRPLPGREETG